MYKSTQHVMLLLSFCIIFFLFWYLIQSKVLRTEGVTNVHIVKPSEAKSVCDSVTDS